MFGTRWRPFRPPGIPISVDASFLGISLVFRGFNRVGLGLALRTPPRSGEA